MQKIIVKTEKRELLEESMRLTLGLPNAYHWVCESEKIIDHDNSSDRKWLASHCFWAMRNGRRVTTHPID